LNFVFVKSTTYFILVVFIVLNVLCPVFLLLNVLDSSPCKYSGQFLAKGFKGFEPLILLKEIGLISEPPALAYYDYCYPPNILSSV